MKIMSIIGIVWFSLSFIFMLAFLESDYEAAMGWGLLGLLYAIPYSITILVLTTKSQKSEKSSIEEIVALNELKEKGAISEDEFNIKKSQLL